MPGLRKTRPSWPFTCLLLLAAAAFAAGCSTSNNTGGGGTSANHVLPSGGSVPGWTISTGGSQHAISATQEFAAGGTLASCTECHGSDLRGGISQTSCFGNPAGCHHGTIAGWVAVAPAIQQHGVWAKRAIGDGSFFSCQICHGSDFSGGGSLVSCFTCHAPPHPSAPWRGAGYTHADTDPSNARVCSTCHFPGSPNNPAGHPATPAPAGTPPGCFNNTLCHGTAAALPHPVGAAWVTTPPAAQPHGNDAKAAPGVATGFAYCQVCHGSGTTSPANFGGGTSQVSCYPCHTVNAPHAPGPWRASAGSTYNHTNTATANAPVCQQCHFPGSPNNPAGHPPTPAPAGTPPGCFNSTLCHNGGGGAPHPVPYNDPAHTTVTAATFPAAFPAGCIACHDVSAPSVKPGPVCQTCHVAASPLTSLNCTSCHANPPDSGAPAGAAYPNIEGAHAEHIALTSAGTPISCGTCHDGLGSGTLAHYVRAGALRVEPGDVAFPAGFLYTGITGTAVTFDNALAALACSNVSCHGALATPNWRTGTTACTSCHNSATVAPVFYTDYTQAFVTHNQHIIDRGIACTTCHTTLPAGTHFGTLSDKAIVSRAAAATINPAFLYPSPPPASVSEANCTTGCH